MSRLPARRRSLSLAGAAVVGLTSLVIAGCAPSDGGIPSPAGPANVTPVNACTKATLQTQTPGTLTIATDQPVYEPWFVDNKPENKQGFESAVAYAVATKLGYADADVKWVRAHFDDVISPTPKKFDFDINEFSITDARTNVTAFNPTKLGESAARIQDNGVEFHYTFDEHRRVSAVKDRAGGGHGFEFDDTLRQLRRTFRSGSPAFRRSTRSSGSGSPTSSSPA
jgi:hypothetical protein